MLNCVDQRNLKSYTDEAPSYDLKRFSTPSRKFYVELSNRIITSLVKPCLGMKILDVATGTGRIALHLARSGATVVGVDLTPAMLHEAKAKAQADGLANLNLQIANARCLPFTSDQFDAVTSIRFFHLVPSSMHRELLSEMLRVTKPGGRVIVEFNNAFCGAIVRPLLDLYYWLVRKQPPGGRLWPHKVQAHFAGFPMVGKRGVWFLGLGRIAQISPKVSFLIDKLAGTFPFYYLTDQLLIVFQKRQSLNTQGARL